MDWSEIIDETIKYNNRLIFDMNILINRIINKEDNEFFLKGKLLFTEHIKRNYIHKEKFYVAYDEYTQNRVENRLLKSTLKYLLSISSSFKNIRLIRIYQEYMSSINLSMNYDNDFRMCDTKTRGMKYYRDALIWAEIF